MAKPNILTDSAHALNRAENHIVRLEEHLSKAIDDKNQAIQYIDDFISEYYNGMKLDALIRNLHTKRQKLDNTLFGRSPSQTRDIDQEFLTLLEDGQRRKKWLTTHYSLGASNIDL